MLLPLKVSEDVAGAREAATEELLEEPVVKPFFLQIREAEKRGDSEGRQRGNARGSEGWGNTTATAKKHWVFELS